MTEESGNRKSSRARSKRALVSGAVPAVVAATTMSGATAQAAPTRQPEPIEPALAAPRCVKHVDRITWHDPENKKYLQIEGASKKNGALVDSAKRDKASKNQEWDAHLTCKFSSQGADLWSFQNVHSGLCLALGPVPHNRVRHEVAQHLCGKHFTQWMFTESRSVPI